MSGLVIKAIITTFDNLPLLKVQLPILRDDPLISEIVVVNQESIDGTREYLDAQPDVISIHRINDGAGKGRNAGLDRAGKFDYVLMLDGGMRPLRPGVQPMLDYMLGHPECDVLGLAWHDLETDATQAWRRWPKPIIDMNVYRYAMLSLTNYCFANCRAFDGIRFCEEGPFGEKGWGADDDELAYQWREAGVNVYAIEGAKAYRRGSGSFRRLFKETGIWPNQYGSVYEQRVVWLQHHYPHQETGMQWGEPWLTVVVQAAHDIEDTARLIKAAHDGLRGRTFDEPWQHVWNPYSVVLWTDDEETLDWAEPRHLRQHHGTVTIVKGEILRRSSQTEARWAGDFRLWSGEDWRGAVRETAHYYGLVKDMAELEQLVARYEERHPAQDGICADKPEVLFEEL